MILTILQNNIFRIYMKFLTWVCKDNFIYFAIYSKKTKEYQILIDYLSIKGIFLTWYYKFFKHKNQILYNQYTMGISIYSQVNKNIYILASYCVIHSKKKVIYAVLNDEIDLTKEINQFGCEAVMCDDIVNVLLKYKNINSYDLTNYKLKVLYESNILQEITLQQGDCF